MGSVPIPLQDPIATPRDPRYPEGRKDPREGLISDPWVKYLQDQSDTLSQSPAIIKTVSLTGQNASIGATSIPTASLSPGLYKVTYYAKIVTAAVTSSSLTVSFGWTDDAISMSASGAAITGNTTATFQTGTLLIEVDQASPVTYSTTYASNGAGEMVYKLSIVMESA